MHKYTNVLQVFQILSTKYWKYSK